MVAGLSGLGKTTTCANLLQSWLEQESSPYHHHPHSQTMEKSQPGKLTQHIDPSRIYSRYDIRTNTLLRVRIIDTPGFGNNINHVCSVQPITDYIEDRRREQYKDETSPKRLDRDGIAEVTQENEEDTSGSDKLVRVVKRKRHI
uniref:Septin-type G domain-containing protein n=1 Tax=Proboscia inermis TaxID=420281 RepID=A0A7S0GIK6_9STRA|mmetsp:Transcript_38913/g.39335  ORF Transcript_38913/g.39335 Transcript_38913/m.39335 type:complete len:144 (+) Transcript_38913:268-699(+)